MDWTDFLQNAGKIRAFYSEAPSLGDVRLFEIRLEVGGPLLIMRFDLSTFPDKVPTKWLKGKFNRAQLTLMLIGVSDLTIEGWDVDNLGGIHIDRDGVGMQLEFSSESSRIECSAVGLAIKEIAGYCSTEE